MNKNTIISAACAVLLTGCFTVSETPFPDVVQSSLGAGKDLSVQLSGFEASVTSYLPVYGYETIHMPVFRGRHRRCYHTATIARETYVPQVENTTIYIDRAVDVLEKCGFTLNNAAPKYRIDVSFSGPFVSNSESAAVLAWTLFSLFTADYGVQTWSARMKIYDVATGKVVLFKDYTQKYESYVWGPIPIFSPGGSEKSNHNFMQNWCLSALTELAMADATAFLHSHAK